MYCFIVALARPKSARWTLASARNQGQWFVLFGGVTTASGQARKYRHLSNSTSENWAQITLCTFRKCSCRAVAPALPRVDSVRTPGRSKDRRKPLWACPALTSTSTGDNGSRNCWCAAGSRFGRGAGRRRHPHSACLGGRRFPGSSLHQSRLATQYSDGEPVTLWLNKIGPYHNPMETYSYYDLPFCAPENRLKPHTKYAGLGEVLEGVEYVNSDSAINFKGEPSMSPPCIKSNGLRPRQATGRPAPSTSTWLWRSPFNCRTCRRAYRRARVPHHVLRHLHD